MESAFNTRFGTNHCGAQNLENKEAETYTFKTNSGNSLIVKILEGCITKTKADCFVHPTNSRKDFFGRVGETLRATGGSEIENVKGTMTDICIEGPPGKLQCKHILHVDIQRCALIGWKKTILVCLEKVEKLRHCSVSFPCLGTGKFGESLETYSERTKEAIEEYCTKRQNAVILINIITVNPDQTWIVKNALDKAKSRESKDTKHYKNAGTQDDDSSKTRGVIPKTHGKRADKGLKMTHDKTENDTLKQTRRVPSDISRSTYDDLKTTHVLTFPSRTAAKDSKRTNDMSRPENTALNDLTEKRGILSPSNTSSKDTRHVYSASVQTHDAQIKDATMTCDISRRLGKSSRGNKTTRDTYLHPQPSLHYDTRPLSGVYELYVTKNVKEAHKITSPRNKLSQIYSEKQTVPEHKQNNTVDTKMTVDVPSHRHSSAKETKSTHKISGHRHPYVTDINTTPGNAYRTKATVTDTKTRPKFSDHKPLSVTDTKTTPKISDDHRKSTITHTKTTPKISDQRPPTVIYTKTTSKISDQRPSTVTDTKTTPKISGHGQAAITDTTSDIRSRVYDILGLEKSDAKDTKTSQGISRNFPSTAADMKTTRTTSVDRPSTQTDTKATRENYRREQSSATDSKKANDIERYRHNTLTNNEPKLAIARDGSTTVANTKHAKVTSNLNHQGQTNAKAIGDVSRHVRYTATDTNQTRCMTDDSISKQRPLFDENDVTYDTQKSQFTAITPAIPHLPNKTAHDKHSQHTKARQGYRSEFNYSPYMAGSGALFPHKKVHPCLSQGKSILEETDGCQTSTSTAPKEDEANNLFMDWTTPLLLIESSDQSTFTVVQDTAEKLAKIKRNLVAVSIVGPYRSGKSYLMNRIAKRQRTGFTVGDTTKAETHGIWIWCLQHPLKKKSVLVLMDSEGFDDVKKGDGEYDDNIFVLNVLLSSTLIYNSTGVLNAEAVNKLESIANMAEKISVTDTDETGDALTTVFPMFIWVVRDFILDLEGKTSDEYLEDALKRQKGAGAKVARYNSTRDCITKYFPGRKCFVLPSLRSEGGFIVENENEKAFREYLMSKSGVKQIGLDKMNGKGLVSLAKSYVKAITENSSIYIHKAWGNFKLEDLNETYLKAVDLFDRCFVNEGQFEKSFDEAMRYFISNKCYDVRYLMYLVVYMNKRKNGEIEKGKAKGLTCEVGPSGTEEDQDIWKVLFDLMKGTASQDFLNELVEDRKRMRDEFTQRFEQMEAHFKHEQIKAQEDQRHRVVDDYKETIEMMVSQYENMKQNYDMTITGMEALKMQNEKMTGFLKKITKTDLEGDELFQMVMKKTKKNACSIM